MSKSDPRAPREDPPPPRSGSEEQKVPDPRRNPDDRSTNFSQPTTTQDNVGVVVPQDFAQIHETVDQPEPPYPPIPRNDQSPPRPSHAVAAKRQLKLPPNTPASPSQSSSKVTTTPPTPASSSSVGTGSSGKLDEFGLPRISPPQGYFDGDNEESPTRNGEESRQEADGTDMRESN
ncbi:uncharacterized protein JCM6883_007253 [Sporobolomyces salmoneus]|uniref:uncharacterized protein n=1 Tax=Sporobolomyces salmoneus TaxID=183962 RepID=UPI0031716C69